MIAPKWKQLKIPSVGGCINVALYVHIVGHRWIVKMKPTNDACYDINECSEDFAKWKKSDTKVHIIWFHLYEMFRVPSSGCLGLAREWGFLGDENVNWIVVKITWL